MKKIIIVLMAFFFSDIAAAISNPPCPPLEIVRNIGNKFTHVYDAGNDFWILWTNDYKVGDDIWMTTLYTPRFPHNTDSAAAMIMGKKLFDSAVLSSNPVRRVQGAAAFCDFSPINSDYTVMVSSGP